ncbi:hypothetical protein ACFFWC_28330 [Plantactinospora siamensis]|uniref:Uncharacterized protein n=1 Tax=Plantactinospora siamensis TaxID=555372 RepID=A0ABV6NV18_9ACTN
MTDKKTRRARPDRARRRAIRAHARLTGVPYSVAARQLAVSRRTAADLRAGETVANCGRTVYPAAVHDLGRWSIQRRERRSADEKVRDTHLAGLLPAGRAQHLADRFPPTRGPAGSGVGPLYSGDGRAELLAMLYLHVGALAPGLVPAAGELAWTARLGEETAVDLACTDLDRAVRHLLDGNRARLWLLLGAALEAGEADPGWPLRREAVRLAAHYRAMMAIGWGPEGEPDVPGPPFEGVRQILDALLVVGDDGHAPGTRVRTPAAGWSGTVVGLRWAAVGPPVEYTVRPDGAGQTVPVQPEALIVLPDQETDLRPLVDVDVG